MIAADGNVFVDLLGIDAAGVFENNGGLMAEERLFAWTKKARDWRALGGGHDFLGVRGGNVFIEDVTRFVADERAERTKTHAADATNTAIGASAFDFCLESGFDGFTV